MKRGRSRDNEEVHWISLSDMMSSLMLIFLVISIAYLVKLQIYVKKLERLEAVEVVINATRQGIHAQLKGLFDANSKEWGAELSPDLTLRFVNPDTLFDSGSAQLKDSYKRSLSAFFPQYLKLMMQPAYQNHIKEIRIEGHTSSFWSSTTTADQAYFLNMELSQRRTRETLAFLLNNTDLDEDEKRWLKKHFRAIGFSSAATLNAAGGPTTSDTDEDIKKSQRVEFRVITNSEDLLFQELEKGTSGL